MFDQSQPIVSLIVPCFNEDLEILTESLNSIRDQSFTNFECILIDESTESSISKACKNFCKSDRRFLYIHPRERIGLAASLNVGIEMAKGRFIARFDSDDICDPSRLALQVDFLEQYPEIGVLGTSLEVINDGGALIGRRRYPLIHCEISKKFIFSSAIAHPSVMFRKSLLSDSGGAYDPTFRYAEDLEFWLRLLKCNVKFANLPNYLIRYRQQELNRNSMHWKYNLKARIKNFSSPHRPAKIMGIFGIALWMLLPEKLQRSLYRVIKLT